MTRWPFSTLLIKWSRMLAQAAARRTRHGDGPGLRAGRAGHTCRVPEPPRHSETFVADRDRHANICVARAKRPVQTEFEPTRRPGSGRCLCTDSEYGPGDSEQDSEARRTAGGHGPATSSSISGPSPGRRGVRPRGLFRGKLMLSSKQLSTRPCQPP